MNRQLRYRDCVGQVSKTLDANRQWSSKNDGQTVKPNFIIDFTDEGIWSGNEPSGRLTLELVAS